MMKNKFGVFNLFFSILLLIQCKNDHNPNDVFSKKDTIGVNKSFKIAPLNAVKSDTPVRSSFNDPVAMANNKFSHFDTILIRDLCTKLWKFDAGIDGDKPLTENDLAGFWLQFSPNGKYEKGTFEKTTSKGNYTVTNQGFIEMTPNDGSEKKSEWQSKFNNDMLILIGTPKYSDNTVQMRLSRIDAKPKKG